MSVITELFLAAFFDFVGFVIGLFPTITLPDWLPTITDYLQAGIASAYGFRHWVPLEALRNAFAFLATVGTTVLAVRVIRILISHFTGGGGAAA